VALNTGLAGIDWIDVTQDGNKLWAVVSTVVNYEDKTSKCIWRYAKLLHYGRSKAATCVGQLFWQSAGRSFV